MNSNPSAPVFDRREFLVTSIFAAGTFAAAVSPITAQTKITTDDKGLIAGEVKIPVGDGQMPAYRAMPDKKGKKFPVVLVVHEIFGVHEWIQDISRRFAKLGYMAIAPALYARQGEVKDLKDPRELNRQIYSKIPDKQSMSDLDASVAWAAKNGGNTKKLSITGFCWGGRNRLALCGSQPHPRCRCRMVWPRHTDAEFASQRSTTDHAGRSRERVESPRPRPIWRAGQGNTARRCSANAGCIKGRKVQI